MKKIPLLILMMATFTAVGCSSSRTLSDAEVERERARANEVHREMDRETR
ncbi:uncharacterized protein YceK [Litorivivens lipolytica]|uniref:Uncharacterized protein YceK n=1 Tax=Litorivivens lipolytica TaxID=1524264 RepID=A0A7W4W382_9GAMM|nr:hypothetical protein [Litorivivens lipolytica]MBB3046630.1 uncharacterized protein YceK [Litorivivens lipolytica]